MLTYLSKLHILRFCLFSMLTSISFWSLVAVTVTRLESFLYTSRITFNILWRWRWRWRWRAPAEAFLHPPACRLHWRESPQEPWRVVCRSQEPEDIYIALPVCMPFSFSEPKPHKSSNFGTMDLYKIRGLFSFQALTSGFMPSAQSVCSCPCSCPCPTAPSIGWGNNLWLINELWVTFTLIYVDLIWP